MVQAKKRYRGIYILTVIFGMVSAFFMSRFSVSLGKLIDVVINPDQILKTTIFVCVGMLVCWLFFSFVYDYVEIVYVNKVVRCLKTNLYETLYNKELKVFLSEKKGEYVGLFSKDIDLIVDNYLIPKCDIVCNFLSAFICMVSIFVLNWKLGLAFIVISGFTVIASQLPGAVMAKKTADYTENNNNYMAVLENYMNGFEQIKLLGLGKLFCRKLNNADFTYERSRKSYLFAKAAALDVGMSFGMLSQLLCMVAGIWFVIHDSMTVGMLISAVQLLNGVFSPLQSFVQNKNLMGTADGIIEKIEKSQAVEEEEAKNEIGTPVSRIEFSDVSISFDNKHILNHFNMKFEKNKKYVIIGESGKGKTTLVKLIMSYYSDQQYEGNILIDGQDVRTLSEDSIFRKIGYIKKNEFLIPGTVFDNIQLYREEIQSNEINDVCRDLKLSQELLHKTISQSSINEISFGEKQRIDVARFLIHDYDVLIFDEPTSNLDTETANEIYNMIFSIKNKIVIVITHDHGKELLDGFDIVIQL